MFTSSIHEEQQGTKRTFNQLIVYETDNGSMERVRAFSIS